MEEMREIIEALVKEKKYFEMVRAIKENLNSREFEHVEEK